MPMNSIAISIPLLNTHILAIIKAIRLAALVLLIAMPFKMYQIILLLSCLVPHLLTVLFPLWLAQLLESSAGQKVSIKDCDPLQKLLLYM